MRSAKLVLAGVAFFAVIGGALAFKAHRGAQIFCREAAQPGVCQVEIGNMTFLSTTQATSGITTYCTNSPTGNCVATVTGFKVQS